MRLFWNFSVHLALVLAATIAAGSRSFAVDPITCAIEQMENEAKGIKTAENTAAAESKPAVPMSADDQLKAQLSKLSQYPNRQEQMKAIASGDVDIARAGPVSEVKTFNQAGLRYNDVDNSRNYVSGKAPQPRVGDVIYVPKTTIKNLGSDFSASNKELQYVQVMVSEDRNGNYVLTPVNKNYRPRSGSTPSNVFVKPDDLRQWYAFP